jgi:hypothetical protein
MSAARALFMAGSAALLVGFLAQLLFGVPLHWAILFGLTTGMVALLGALLAGNMDANWEAVPNPVTSAPELHASSLAMRFAEAAEDNSRFLSRVRPRLARCALATLRARPDTADLTSLDDPRARDALGAELHALLTDARAVLPAPRQLAEMLAQLEET